MRIFISFSRRDHSQALEIANRLEGAGHEVWIDDLKLVPGDNIAQKVESRISEADAFLFLVSANALKSKFVLQEFSSFALTEVSKRKQRIIAVLLDASTVPSYLSNYLYLDLHRDFKLGLERLVTALGVLEQDEPIVPRKASDQNFNNVAGQIAALATVLKAGRLTLVCGAGVSVNAGILAWTPLLLRLLESMIDRISRDQSLTLSSNAAQAFGQRHGASPLILAKYLKNSLGRDFQKEVRDALYSANPTTCRLIDAIVELARPQRNGRPLDSIITFNFDGLIGENLTKSAVRNRAIYTEAITHDSNELPVYHVHGYLPREGEVPEDADIVFSEDAYHTRFIDSFSWSNLVQLNKLTQNTCLFIGVSLTDPNLRRLLDVAWRKNPDKTLSHYMFKKLPHIENEDTDLDNLARLLEEQDANTLGVNVIWIDDYDQIPHLLAAINEA